MILKQIKENESQKSAPPSFQVLKEGFLLCMGQLCSAGVLWGGANHLRTSPTLRASNPQKLTGGRHEHHVKSKSSTNKRGH